MPFVRVLFVLKLAVSMLLFILVSVWRIFRPALMCMCPTSELPIWFFGSPTSSPEAEIRVFG